MPYLVVIIPCLGTLNGSILVGSSIINTLVNDRTYVWGMDCIGIYLYGCLVFLYYLKADLNFIMKKLAFFVYLFYGMSIIGMFVLRRRDKEIERKFKVYTGVGVFAVMFSIYIVGFAIYSSFIK